MSKGKIDSDISGLLDRHVNTELLDVHAVADCFALGIPRGMGIYQRFDHKTLNALAGRLAQLEGGEDALVFASGMGATAALLFSQLRHGDHFVASSRLYGGTRGIITWLAALLELRVSVVDITDHAEVARVCRIPGTKLLWAESISNPELTATDIPAIRQIINECGQSVTFIIDSTFIPPVALRPIVLGADVVMHSLTKYYSGYSDTMGGALIGSRVLIDKLRHPSGVASLLGSTMSSRDALRLIRRMPGLQTRFAKASERAHHVAEILLAHGLKVHCVTLPGDPGKEVLMRMDCPWGGGVISVEFPTEAEGVNFTNAVGAVRLGKQGLRLGRPMVSLGGADTYVWCFTEPRVKAMKKATPFEFAPVPPGFVRIALGHGGSEPMMLRGFASVLKSLGYRSL